jgi:hypothetical protein
MAADEGRGATITTGTSNWGTGSGESPATLITNISFDGITRDPLETTVLTTSTARTFTPSDLYDAGGMTIEFFYEGDEVFHATGSPPPGVPYTSAAETWTVTDPIPSGKNTGPTMAASGFIDNFTPGAKAVGELMRGSVHVKFTGAVTFADST